MQCLTQAVPLAALKGQTSKKEQSEGHAALLQLPGMDTQVARLLVKKRVRTISGKTRLLLSLTRYCDQICWGWKKNKGIKP